MWGGSTPSLPSSMSCVTPKHSYLRHPLNATISSTTSTTPPNTRKMSPVTPATGPSTPATQTEKDYQFPSHRLARTLTDPSKTPLVLVACGSFSPITHMHLRMFEMAVDHVRQNMSDEYEVIGGYMSPVSDRYNKAGLASATHR